LDHGNGLAVFCLAANLLTALPTKNSFGRLQG
jgi:hypothetical protein